MEWMDSVPITLLQKDLDGLWTRQRAVSNNIANFETPGYKSKSVSFEDLLRAQVSDPSKTEGETVQGLESVQPVTEELPDVYRADGNGVFPETAANFFERALQGKFAAVENRDPAADAFHVGKNMCGK